uniref:Myosin phosphatase Rho interacting protein n=1 Tax=Oryzias latipes TaxID=8090 RepID=A0A3P9IA78_ORYLA
MSAAKENPCRKFQANFFNKSKCQNCFKPRELHLLTDQDLTQAKPIYAGWLCLAPEGTDFDNPMQRSRKWQRRFFVLYEHGCLRFALDESPSTLPQGTVNMNHCTDVIDAEPKTGQKNSLCIITPEQEYFIRGESKEIINGWSEQLIVYPRTNKQNQKKKRKVEPTTSQEPGPAKVAVTGSGIPEAEKVPDSSSIIWQEELNQREAEGGTVWTAADQPSGSPLPPTGDVGSVGPSSDAGSVNGDNVDWSSQPLLGSAPQAPGDLLSPTGSCSSLGGVPRCPSPVPSDPFPSGSSVLSNGSHISGSVSSLDSDASGSTVTSNDSHQPSHRVGHHDTTRARRMEAEARKAEKRGRFRSPERQDREAVFSPERSRCGVIEKLEALELENPEKMEVEEAGRGGGRQGRSEYRSYRQELRQDPDPGLDFPSRLPPLRRAKSLDRRTTESVMTPDLLNFKKGWMVKLDEQGQWKKYWFVLTDHSLRYYKDSIAEEASDLDGEIDLSTCYSVTEYQAQRNYGFQIHTLDGVHTLSAMTAGIRRNWIQAVMKNVRPSTAPDVASSTEDHGSFTPLEGLVRPDVAQDLASSEASFVAREPSAGVARSRARERRREGRSKTFDWAEFRPIAQALAQQRAQEAEGLQADASEPERSRRREERRKRYESVTSSEHRSSTEGGRTDCEGSVPDSLSPISLERQQRVEEVIEEHWRQVEKTPIREERRVPLASTTPATRDTAELELLLDSYKQGIKELKAQLESCHQQLLHSNKHKQELEFQLRTALEREQHVRTGYISPLEHPLGLEADVAPQMKSPQPVSSQAQSLTKKYQETKELLKLQELKKRNMQAQLRLSLSHSSLKDADFSEQQEAALLEGIPSEPIQKTVSLLLQDSPEAIQELEELAAEKPLTVRELGKLLKCHSTEKHQLQELLETWKCKQEVENELMRSLARAGESIREYEARLLNMEDAMEKVKRQSSESQSRPHSSSAKVEDPTDMKGAAVGWLSQKAELLTEENGALKQRCQEIMNQLTEADREIDRLKAELSSQHHPMAEQLKKLKAELAENQASVIDREYYERELNEKSLRLHEALVTLEELGSTLADTEKKLQLKEATLIGLGFQADYCDKEAFPQKEQLTQLPESSQATFLETKESLQAAEQHCVELEARNRELGALNQDIEHVSKQRLLEVEQEVKRLRCALEANMGKDEQERTDGKRSDAGPKQVDHRGPLEEVVGNLERTCEAISQVVEMLAEVNPNVEDMFSRLKRALSESHENPLCLSEVDMISVLEWEFWSQLQSIPGSETNRCEAWLAERILALQSLLLLKTPVCFPAQTQSEPAAAFASAYSCMDEETHAQVLKQLTETLGGKFRHLKQIVSSLKSDRDDKVLSLALESFGPERHQEQPADYLQVSLKEACFSYVIIRLQGWPKKELQQADDPQLSETSTHGALEPGTEGELKDSVDGATELSGVVARLRQDLLTVTSSYQQETQELKKQLAQTNQELHLQAEESRERIDSLTGCMESLKQQHEAERRKLTEQFDREMEELRSMMSPAWNGTDRRTAPLQASAPTASTLRERIQELLTQLSVMTEETRRREELGDVATLRLKYERDLENLKATCERGFAAMEESHQKVIEELQRKHQRELENLQEEKDRLLAEETAATIAAIEAMKNAHRSELEKELEKARKASSNTENADIEGIRRQHEEELCSFHREIEVLSEQYSQKCLENAHLAQALEAERQALRQCQRENQELNSHNQELNNRLAAEITKMRSMTSEDGTGDPGATIQGKELYELEVMLRVKESEVQYLKQEINSLKEELQAAQRDKKYAADKYKDIYTELSIVKAKAECDVGRLRDQLQLAHEALGDPSADDADRGGYDIMKSKSNPDILKMAAAAAKRSERTMRSKSLKEGLTAEQRLHLFDNKDTKEF